MLHGSSQTSKRVGLALFQKATSAAGAHISQKEYVKQIVSDLRSKVRAKKTGWEDKIILDTGFFFQNKEREYRQFYKAIVSLFCLRSEAFLSLDQPRLALHAARRAHDVLSERADDEGGDEGRRSFAKKYFSRLVRRVVYLKKLSCERLRELHGRRLYMSATWYGVSAHWLVSFAIDRVAAHELACATTGNVCFRYVRPATSAFKMTYIDAFLSERSKNGFLGRSTCFVSHAWGGTFLSLVQSVVLSQLRSHDELCADTPAVSSAQRLFEACCTKDPSTQLLMMRDALKKVKPATREYYWIDIFCKNQHRVESDATADELGRCVSNSGKMMLALEPISARPLALTRVWCLFEVLECLISRVPFFCAPSFEGMLFMDNLVLHNRSDRAGKKPSKTKRKGLKDTEDKVLNALRNHTDSLEMSIDVTRAQATFASDRDKIFGLVRRALKGGTRDMNKLVRLGVRKSIVRWKLTLLRAWARMKGSRRWMRRVGDLEEDLEEPTISVGGRGA